jgi:hypothetical protein
MFCKSCHSNNQRLFTAEMNIHFPPSDGWEKPTVWAFPEIVVCLNCGFTELSLSETELEYLRNAIALPLSFEM